MASKYRPKGSYKDYLDLTGNQLAELTNEQLQGITSKLNDAANKRMTRLEQQGIELLSPGYRGRLESKKGRFTLSRKETRGQLMDKYLAARRFLNPETGTSTRSQVEEYVKKYENLYHDVLGTDFDDPKLYDKRYKRKKVLLTPVRDKIADFWNKYHEWREIELKNNPQSGSEGSPIELAEQYEEQFYSKGKTSLDDYKKAAKQKYKEAEKKRLEEYGEDKLNEGGELPIAATKQRGAQSPIKSKYKTKRTSKYEPKQRFEKIKIL